MRHLRSLLPLFCLLLAVSLLFWHRDAVLATVDAALLRLSPPLAGLLFVVVFMLGEALLIPGALLMVLGGAVFGVAWGFVLNMIGFTSGAALAFLIARSQLRGKVLRWLPAGTVSLLESHALGSWQTVAVVRLVGIIPGVLLNYALGLTAISFRTFLWASVLFTLPTGGLLTYAGAAGEEFAREGKLGNLLVAIGLLALLAAGAEIWRRQLQRRRKQS
jgi:uncharacterized membrane protein YdjX (TVP38/TMEM64 family)